MSTSPVRLNTYQFLLNLKSRQFVGDHLGYRERAIAANPQDAIALITQQYGADLTGIMTGPMEVAVAKDALAGAAQSGGSGSVPVSSVPNQDCYLLPFDLPTMFSSSGATGTMGVANHVRAIQTVLTRQVTVTKVTINVTATSAGNKEFIGIYSADKNTLLMQASFTLGAGIGVMTVAIPQVVLQPGTVWLARGADQTTSIIVGAVIGTNPYTLFQGGSIVRYGDSPNVIVGGVMPASLGVVTASGTNPPCVLLEP